MMRTWRNRKQEFELVLGATDRTVGSRRAALPQATDPVPVYPIDCLTGVGSKCG
jgi:hypothetical protein